MPYINKHPPEYWAARKEEYRLRKLAKMRAKYKDNPDKFLERQKSWRAANPDYRYQLNDEQKLKRKLANKRWHEANPDKDKQYAKSKRLRGMFRTPKLRARSAKRRILAKYAIHPEHDAALEAALFLECQRLSNETGLIHELDHIIPLSKGGFHHHLNLQPLPRKLNKHKHNDPFWQMEGYKSWRDVPKGLWPKYLYETYQQLSG